LVQTREEGRGISLVSLRWPLICRPTQTGRGSGLSTGIRFTGLASFCSPPVARCGSGRSSAGSSVQRVGRYPARPQVGSERSLWCHPSPELSGAARQLARVGACFSFGVGVLLTVLLIPPLLARIRAEERLLRTDSAASTMCTAVVHGALFPDSFEEMGGEAHCLTGN
jgi:hypothetical protein